MRSTRERAGFGRLVFSGRDPAFSRFGSIGRATSLRLMISGQDTTERDQSTLWRRGSPDMPYGRGAALRRTSLGFPKGRPRDGGADHAAVRFLGIALVRRLGGE